MDLNMLYVLEQLITQGSFKQVAEQCFTSTSTLTRQMNSFEAELGFTLLERTPSGISLGFWVQK